MTGAWGAPRERFERYVSPEPNSGCHLWTGGKSKSGYGAFHMGKETVPAHRAAWKIYCGSIPSGQSILHKCDVCLCVNIDHLYIGDALQNVKDRDTRGRTFAKLTNAQVAEIRSSKEVHETLADKYNVSRTQISRIKRGHRSGRLEYRNG